MSLTGSSTNSAAYEQEAQRTPEKQQPVVLRQLPQLPVVRTRPPVVETGRCSDLRLPYATRIGGDAGRRFFGVHFRRSTHHELPRKALSPWRGQWPLSVGQRLELLGHMARPCQAERVYCGSPLPFTKHRLAVAYGRRGQPERVRRCGPGRERALIQVELCDPSIDAAHRTRPMLQRVEDLGVRRELVVKPVILMSHCGITGPAVTASWSGFRNVLNRIPPKETRCDERLTVTRTRLGRRPTAPCCRSRRAAKA